jgi:hypothetical protein
MDSRMAKNGGSQKLKDQNRWQLWLIIAANAVVFYGACQWETFELSGLKAALAGAANLLPVGLAVVVTTIANGLLSSPTKDGWCSCAGIMRFPDIAPSASMRRQTPG